ncbi:MAG: PIG-L family deacetylase [Flavobacteriaceae bacterium]
MTDYKKNISPYLFLIFSFFIAGTAWSQSPERLSSSALKKRIEKLNFLGSALYFAAHPDDENTRLISYLANDVQAEVGYLSLTRGDGGQNLIGVEIREGLGVIRTQELLQARRRDGGQQFFSTANDFGYSKNPSETFSIWDKEKVLSDATWIVRNFEPDIIINRFDHRTPGTTHGHHTSSAMVSYEIFEGLSDPSVFPDQGKVWSPSRLFFNTSSWFYGGRQAFEKMDRSHLFKVDVGTYYPELSYSNGEIAAESRSMHKSQGFGAGGGRGSQQEYLELLKGESADNKEDLFAGINTTWSRVPGGAHITEMINQVLVDYDLSHPEASLKALLEVKSEIEALKPHHWKAIKLGEIQNLIAHCAGIYMDFTSEDSYASPGSEVKAQAHVLSPAANTILLKSARVVYSNGKEQKVAWSPSNLEKNVSYEKSIDLNLDQDLDLSNPYWLNKPWKKGNYQVEDYNKVGKPEMPAVIQFVVELEFEGMSFELQSPLQHRFTDPVRGEVYDPFHVVAPFAVNFDSEVHVFATSEAQEISVIIKSFKANATGEVALDLAKGWKVSPSKQAFEISQKGGEQRLKFTVTPPKQTDEAYLTAQVNDKYEASLMEISYDHIPKQRVFTPAFSKMVRVQMEKKGEKVAYIMGAGDKVPEAISQMGYQVSLLEESRWSLDEFKNYDAIVLGIRALNVKPNLNYHMQELFEYAKQGGTVILQYNVSRGIKVSEIGPYPISLSRDRVTVEEAEVRILAPNHAVIQGPNAIGANDFENWVQERGLYFPNAWDDHYTAILGANDPNEPSRNGGLLIANYGQGYFVYTGYSWFRELPAGVPGAYRIFANLLSLGN